jgi:hypothetical protein
MNKNEIRIKDASGGEKCSKLAQMADIPASVLLELMTHYGRGRAKYPGDALGPNYTKGYPWSLSYNAAMRHLLQFWGGEDIDAETGSKHVIAAAWHCLALALFMERHPEKDDRWESRKISVDEVYDLDATTAILKRWGVAAPTKEALRRYIQGNPEEFIN